MTSAEYKSLDKKVDRILDHIEAQTRFNLDVHGRVVALETNQANASKLSAKVSGVVGAVVTAVINGVFLLAGGHR